MRLQEQMADAVQFKNPCGKFGAPWLSQVPLRRFEGEGALELTPLGRKQLAGLPPSVHAL